ncbi:hypothetical protein PVAND_015695 [Polypedilum vanderplanki]|uniref:Fatty acyl-CoA reductase n=1 Tax=Polypedilum vanderplanki TaxID=319348 RepID=A0A9J6BD06_POLVA|nr:hypothetical protein PVAND_015695 [Polypedilum vanderplanki]
MEVSAENSIHKFFENSEIFISGGSGFVGRVLIEKLLRTCKGVKKIYLLLRSKKNDTPWERIQKLTDCKLFESLKASDPTAINKIHVLKGDAMELELGLSKSDLEIVKNCSVIFHCAASVRFDDSLKDAILLNTRGTREICKIAEEMKNLKAFVHVSTSFIVPKLHGSDEIFYPADCDWQKMIQFAENFDYDLINCLEKKLTKFAPNTYTFSKHLAEQVCEYYKKSKNLPIVIYRPSLIAGTEVEPFPGWLDNLYGPFAFAFSGALGINHISHVKGDIVLDFIPVDICVKGMLIAAWKTWKDKNSLMPIYNASNVKKASIISISKYKILKDFPPKNAIMYHDHHHTQCRFIGWIIRIIDQIIPALIIDGLLKISGKKTKMMRYQRIIYDALNNITIFTKENFHFTNFKFLDLNLEVPTNEKKDFFINELYPQMNMKQMNEILNNLLEIFFNQKPEHKEMAKKRYFYVILFSRMYQIFAYSGFFYLVYKLLDKSLTQIDFSDMIFNENFVI